MSKVIRRYFVFFHLIRCKIKINHDLAVRAFPRFTQFGWFCFELSLALKAFPFLLIGSCDYFGFVFLWHLIKGRFKPGYLPTFGFWGRRRETSHFQENKGITDRHRSVIILSWFIIFRTTQVNHQLISLSSNHLIKHTDNYTMTSVCIFSILFSIHFLRCWQGEFV